MAEDESSRLAPSVEKPRPRMRLGFVVALLLVMALGVGTLLWRTRTTVPPPRHAANWWADVGPHCTSLEVDLTVRGAALDPGQRATCLAVAGKLDRARQILLDIRDYPERAKAVSTLFEIAHPIADAGDDRSAGPIMHLVVELWPENYMAVFHAGMADFALGHDDAAKPMLERFLVMYSQHDIWRERAEQALAAIAAHTPLEQREAHFAE